MTTVNRLGYRPALDGLRGLAVLAVLSINSLLPFFKGGFIGVDVFFVLSGFLITTLLAAEWDETGMIRLRQFYLRRALRLLPGLGVLLLCCTAYGILFQSAEAAEQTLLSVKWTFFYGMNWLLIRHHELGTLDHAWSLSVEEQFYIVWPVLLAVLLRRRIQRGTVAAVLTLLIIASMTWRFILWQGGAHYLRIYYGSDTRTEALLIGCLVGLFFTWGWLPRNINATRWIQALASIAAGFLFLMVFFVRVDSRFLFVERFTVTALAAGILIMAIIQHPTNSFERVLSTPLLVWLGQISYSLYLWHWPIFRVLRPSRMAALGWNGIVVEGIRFTLVFAAASLSYYLVEKPILNLKQRIIH